MEKTKSQDNNNPNNIIILIYSNCCNKILLEIETMNLKSLPPLF